MLCNGKYCKQKFAMLWLHKTEEVHAYKEHYSRNITGDIFESGWINEMYGYSFGAAELNLRHLISSEILIYPEYVPEPGVKYRVFHYGLEYRVGNWSFDKANWRNTELINEWWANFPDPPDSSTLNTSDNNAMQRDLLSIECAKTLNEAIRLHHIRRNCPDPNSLSTPNKVNEKDTAISRKFGRFDGGQFIMSKTTPINRSFESSSDGLTDDVVKNRTLGPLRIWVVFMWICCVLGFVLVISLLVITCISQG